MRATLRDEDSAEWRSATEARFARAPVDVVLELKTAPRALCVHVVRNRGAARGQRIGEYVGDGLVKTLEAVRAEVRGSA